MKSLPHYMKYSLAAFYLMAVLFFPPLNNSAFSQQTLKLEKDEATDMVNFITHLYRSNILNFTEKYENLYQEESPLELKRLFRDQVLNSLTIVGLANWKLPRFIVSSDGDLVVNKLLVFNVSEKRVKEGVELEFNDKKEIEKELKRYEIELTKERKKECVDALRENPFYIKEVDDNYIIGVNLIPKEGRVHDLFNDTIVKSNCVKCHLKITGNKEMFTYNVEELNCAVVFEVPVKK